MEKLIRFFDIGPETMRDANLVWPLVEGDVIGDSRISAHEANAGISLSDQTTEHFKVAHIKYWSELFIARFNQRYFNEASLAGIRHREMGLDVQWYVARCTKIKMDFLRLILGARLPLSLKAKLAPALEKYVALNMAIAVSSCASWLIDDLSATCGVESCRGCPCPDCERRS